MALTSSVLLALGDTLKRYLKQMSKKAITTLLKSYLSLVAHYIMLR
jgi:hypothetical protein